MKASEYFKDDNPYYAALFKEMAHRVGLTLNDIEIENHNWPYDRYQWTEEEQNDYKKWAVEYMYKNRKKLYARRITKKRIREHEVPMFLLLYAWKLNNPTVG